MWPDPAPAGVMCGRCSDAVADTYGRGRGRAAGGQPLAERGGGDPAGRAPRAATPPVPRVSCTRVPGPLRRRHAGQAHRRAGQLLTADLSLSLRCPSFVACGALRAAPRFLGCPVDRGPSHCPPDLATPCPGSRVCGVEGGGWCPAPPAPAWAMLPHALAVSPVPWSLSGGAHGPRGSLQTAALQVSWAALLFLSNRGAFENCEWNVLLEFTLHFC